MVKRWIGLAADGDPWAPEFKRMEVVAAADYDQVVAALRSSPCPRPIGNDDGTVADCILAGHCGCDNGVVLSTPEPGPWPEHPAAIKQEGVK